VSRSPIRSGRHRSADPEHRAARRPAARLIAAGAALALLLGAAACSSGGNAGTADTAGNANNAGSTSSAGQSAPGQSDSGSSTATNTVIPDQPVGNATLTIYSGQHEALVQALTAAFTKATGIKTTIRAGEDAELANQIIEEGAASPADLYLSEEPGPVGLLDSKGLLAKVDPATLQEADQRLVPSTGDWLPYAARSRALFYDPKLISEADLPHSIMDLTQPQWKGKFAYAPSGAFTATVSYLIDTIGSDKTLDWLKGIKANGINEQTNGKVRDSVEAGQHAFGLSNHYYWYILAAQKGGADKLASRVYFFDHPDAGGLLLASGAGVIKASKHQAEAQEFLKWLGSADGGQQVIAGAQAAQFPVAPGVVSKTPGMPSLADLKAPNVDSSIYADTTEAQALIIKAGMS
jgi:iron(III) transport system substrate-binding protein